MDLDKILSLIRTQSEANDLLVQLNGLMANVYSTKKISLQDYFPNLPKELTDELLQEMTKINITENKNLLKDFINKLQVQIHACKTLEITLAFKPDDQTISLFSTWAKKNIGSNILLDITVNKEVVGGAIIIAGGQYRDLSVQKKLAQVFQIQKEEIMKLLSPVIAPV